MSAAEDLPISPKSAVRLHTPIFLFLLTIVCLNLAWEHQTILIQMIPTGDYYRLAVVAPFVFRILPALLYRALMMGHGDIATGLNEPFAHSYSIFQLVLDSLCLGMTFFFLRKIARTCNPAARDGVLSLFAGLAGVTIVVFGFLLVPNRPLFYPYDFPDMCLAAVIFYLCIKLEGPAEWFLPCAVFVAALNKETAIFYSGLYLVMRMGKPVNWPRTIAVLAACGAAGVLARLAVIVLIPQLASQPPGNHGQYEFHLLQTLGQLRSPIFIFATLNICSYLYVPVFLLRKRFDLTDRLIVLMIAGWIMIMAVFGVFRELRIFVPASLLMFVIICRHFQAFISLAMGVPDAVSNRTSKQPY